MFCANCGQKLPDNAVFCNKCGMKVNEPAFEPVANNENKTDVVQNSTNADAKNSFANASTGVPVMTPTGIRQQGNGNVQHNNLQQQNTANVGAAIITKHIATNTTVQNVPTPPLQQDENALQTEPINNSFTADNNPSGNKPVSTSSNQWKDTFAKNQKYIIGVLVLLLAVGGGVLFSKFLSSPKEAVVATKPKQPVVSSEVKANTSNMETANTKQVVTQSYSYVLGTDVKARADASMQANVVGTYDLGEKVLVIDEQGEWAKVKRANGMECFISRKFLGTQEDLNRRTGKQSTAPNIPAGAIVNAYHSSADQEGNYIHSGRLAVDGNTNTCWSEGVKGLGIGENIEIHFNGNYRVNGMNIWIGHQKSQQLFYQNARPTAVRILGSDGSNEVYYLNDTYGMQRVNFKYPITVNKVKVAVERVAPGNKYEDTCIAEVNFF